MTKRIARVLHIIPAKQEKSEILMGGCQIGRHRYRSTHPFNCRIEFSSAVGEQSEIHTGFAAFRKHIERVPVRGFGGIGAIDSDGATFAAPR